MKCGYQFHKRSRGAHSSSIMVDAAAQWFAECWPGILNFTGTEKFSRAIFCSLKHFGKIIAHSGDGKNRDASHIVRTFSWIGCSKTRLHLLMDAKSSSTISGLTAWPLKVSVRALGNWGLTNMSCWHGRTFLNRSYLPFAWAPEEHHMSKVAKQWRNGKFTLTPNLYQSIHNA